MYENYLSSHISLLLTFLLYSASNFVRPPAITTVIVAKIGSIHQTDHEAIEDIYKKGFVMYTSILVRL